jgi:hypothetical protein
VDLAQFGYAKTEHTPNKVCDTHSDEQSRYPILRRKRRRFRHGNEFRNANQDRAALFGALRSTIVDFHHTDASAVIQSRQQRSIEIRR